MYVVGEYLHLSVFFAGICSFFIFFYHPDVKNHEQSFCDPPVPAECPTLGLTLSEPGAG